MRCSSYTYIRNACFRKMSLTISTWLVNGRITPFYLWHICQNNTSFKQTKCHTSLHSQRKFKYSHTSFFRKHNQKMTEKCYLQIYYANTPFPIQTRTGNTCKFWDERFSWKPPRFLEMSCLMSFSLCLRIQFAMVWMITRSLGASSHQSGTRAFNLTGLVH